MNEFPPSQSHLFELAYRTSRTFEVKVDSIQQENEFFSRKFYKFLQEFRQHAAHQQVPSVCHEPPVPHDAIFWLEECIPKLEESANKVQIAMQEAMAWEVQAKIFTQQLQEQVTKL